jgi:hypothetical protein
MGEWRYGSTYPESLHYMAVNGQPVAGRFIPTQPRTQWAGGWVGPRAGLRALDSDKTPAFTGNRTPIPRSSRRILVTTPTYVSHLRIPDVIVPWPCTHRNFQWNTEHTSQPPPAFRITETCNTMPCDRTQVYGRFRGSCYIHHRGYSKARPDGVRSNNKMIFSHLRGIRKI